MVKLLQAVTFMDYAKNINWWEHKEKIFSKTANKINNKQGYNGQCGGWRCWDDSNLTHKTTHVYIYNGNMQVWGKTRSKTWNERWWMVVWSKKTLGSYGSDQLSPVCRTTMPALYRQMALQPRPVDRPHQTFRQILWSSPFARDAGGLFLDRRSWEPTCRRVLSERHICRRNLWSSLQTLMGLCFYWINFDQVDGTWMQYN